MIQSVAVLLTVFNRCSTTLRGLETLSALIAADTARRYDIFMTDDGSTDGTTEAVRRRFPGVHIVGGNDLYWSRGMNAAWRAALAHGDYDAFLWFNDDGILHTRALKLIFEPYASMPLSTISVGAFSDSLGHTSYGGQDEAERWLDPDGTFRRVWLMNGNLVLIPRAVYDRVGLIGSAFRHGSGDYDYGIRARRAGCDVVLTSTFVGLCDRHDDDRHPWLQPGASLSRRLALITSPKFCPWPHAVFLYRAKGLYPAAHFLIETILSALFPKYFSNL